MSELNQGQQLVCDAAIDWFKSSSEQTFQIDAEAGTGKTYTVSEIIKRLKLKPDEILPMAYTGQAALVMRKHGFETACTCHSGLFNHTKEPILDKRGKPVLDPKFNTPLYKWVFTPKRIDPKVKLIVLDEAWMIPSTFRRNIDEKGIKVIAVGDSGQLPPVKDSPGYLIDGIIYHLDQIMRQAENSPIVYVAHKLRRGENVDFGVYGDSVIVSGLDDISNLDSTLIAYSNIILCGRNDTRIKINKYIRNNVLGIANDYPIYGDRVICRKNDWGESNFEDIPLVNGLRGTIINIPDVANYDRKTKCLDIDFMPDLSAFPFRDIGLNMQYMMSKDPNEKEFIKNDKFAKGDMFDYAYGSTVHVAQGSEYYSGIYLEEYMNSRMQNALNYTGITRFKGKVVYLKYKHKYW